MPEGSSALSTFLLGGPWWTAFLNAARSGRSIDNALGYAAAMGVSLAVLRVLSQSIASGSSTGEEQQSRAFYLQIRELLRGILWEGKRIKAQEKQDEEDDEGEQEVMYYGSCHCKSVEFELIASRRLEANKDGIGKIHYPNTRIPAVDFRFNKGEDLLHMYYVSVPASGSTSGVEPIKAAHSFCSRCGVHILHAPDASASVLDVNLDCFESFQKIEFAPQRLNLSAGVPVRGQWNSTPTARIHKEEGPSRDLVDPEVEGAERSFDQLTVETDDPTQVYFEKPDWKPPRVSSSFSVPGTFVSPATPATTVTTGTESLSVFQSRRSSPFDSQDSAAGESSLDSFRLNDAPVPTVETAANTSTTPTATTPMMRDQLKYFMSKYSNENKKLSGKSVSQVSTATATAAVN